MNNDIKIGDDANMPSLIKLTSCEICLLIPYQRTKLSGLGLVTFKLVETFTRTTAVFPSPLEQLVSHSTSTI